MRVCRVDVQGITWVKADDIIQVLVSALNSSGVNGTKEEILAAFVARAAGPDIDMPDPPAFPAPEPSPHASPAGDNSSLQPSPIYAPREHSPVEDPLLTVQQHQQEAAVAAAAAGVAPVYGLLSHARRLPAPPARYAAAFSRRNTSLPASESPARPLPASQAAAAAVPQTGAGEIPGIYCWLFCYLLMDVLPLLTGLFLVCRPVES